MVMAFKQQLSHGKHLQHHNQSKCTKVDAEIMLTGFMDDAVILHSADAVQGKTGNHHFYLAGMRCLRYSLVVRCMENS